MRSHHATFHDEDTMKSLRTLQRLVLAVCLSATFASSASAAPQNARPIVHLIAIGDSDVGDIGRYVGEDARNTTAAFQQAFEQAGKSHQLNSILILGGEVREKAIRRRIENLKVGPYDTIVLLYSGHGHTDQNQQHRLNFSHDAGSMRRADMLALLKSKNARLTVLLTDVCSGYGRNSALPVVPSVETKQPRNLRPAQVIDWRTIDSLFLKHAGVIDITAAEPGYNAQVNFPNVGSHFTNALLDLLKVPYVDLVAGLDRDQDGAVQWDEVLPQLRGDAAQRDTRRAASRSQQAYAWSMGRWKPTGIVAP